MQIEQLEPLIAPCLGSGEGAKQARYFWMEGNISGDLEKLETNSVKLFSWITESG